MCDVPCCEMCDAEAIYRRRRFALNLSVSRRFKGVVRLKLAECEGTIS